MNLPVLQKQDKFTSLGTIGVILVFFVCYGFFYQIGMNWDKRGKIVRVRPIPVIPSRNKRENHSVADALSVNAEDSVKIEEMFEILKTTPNLWGYRSEERRQQSVPNRIQEQRRWIKRIATTEFIKNSTPKKLLVYLEENDLYHATNNEVNCPYAHEFKEKCSIQIVAGFDWRKLLPNPPQPYLYKYHGVDAVIGIRNGFWGLDYSSSYKEQHLPSGVTPIYWQNESPCHTGSARIGETGAWLVSYWRGSDIEIPPFELIEEGTRDRISGVKYEMIPGIDTRFPKFDQMQEQDTKIKKKKLAAGLISNCFLMKNNRLGYISELMKHMAVDLYGKCGSLSCPYGKNCTAWLGQNYKFYLAFENCNCEDYITEKFFVTSLLHGIVPIVMGPSKENYAAFAPPHSFIHVGDFSSPKQLSEFILALDKDDAKYQSYFDWRRDNKKSWILSGSIELNLLNLLNQTCS